MISFLVADEQLKTFMGDKYTMQRECFFEATFKKGTYLAYVETTQQRVDARDIVISAYSNNEITFTLKEIHDPT